jgi:hypothetical protein
MQSEPTGAGRPTQTDFAAAVADGTIRAHLRADELAPLIDALNALYVHDRPPAGRDADGAAYVRKVAEAYQRFALDPLHAPAFERFTAELEAQAEREAAASSPQAGRLTALADLWVSRWRDDTVLTAGLLGASLKRLLAEPQNESGAGGTPAP